MHSFTHYSITVFSTNVGLGGRDGSTNGSHLWPRKSNPLKGSPPHLPALGGGMTPHPTTFHPPSTLVASIAGLWWTPTLVANHQEAMFVASIAGLRKRILRDSCHSRGGGRRGRILSLPLRRPLLLFPLFYPLSD